MQITVDIGFIAAFIAINAAFIGIVAYFATLRAQMKWLYDAHHDPDNYGFGEAKVFHAQRLLLRDFKRLAALIVWALQSDKDDKPPTWAKDMINVASDPGLLADREMEEAEHVSNQ